MFASDSADILLDIAGYYTDNAPRPTWSITRSLPAERLTRASSTGRLRARSVLRRWQLRRHGAPVPRKALLLDSGRGSRLLSDMTITAVPPGPLAFLIAWPSGGLQPNVSSINSFASRILANSVIIPAGADGSIDVFAFNATDFLVDINGYYAPDDGATGLFYFPAQQCRAADTTNAAYSGAFGGPAFAANTARTIPVAASPFCSGIPANA